MTLEQTTVLRETLASMLNTISRKQPIVDHLTQLSHIQQEIAPVAPAQLMHYLANRSYTKAFEFLTEGTVIEPADRPDCDKDCP